MRAMVLGIPNVGKSTYNKSFNEGVVELYSQIDNLDSSLLNSCNKI